MAEKAFARRENRETKAKIKAVKEAKKEHDNKVAEDIAKQLPVPKGYKILIMLPEIEDTTAGGIIKAAQTKQIEEVGSIVGFVLELGPDAYADKERFSEPYCKKGDWIIMRSYSGTRFTIHGKEFRLINDDTVEATVDDPRGIVKR